jgi:hypothetical protein
MEPGRKRESMPNKADDQRLVKKTVFLTAAEWRALKILAAMTDRGASEVLREALEEYLAKHKPPVPR